jgi:hypothetical protein
LDDDPFKGPWLPFFIFQMMQYFDKAAWKGQNDSRFDAIIAAKLG